MGFMVEKRCSMAANGITRKHPIKFASIYLQKRIIIIIIQYWRVCIGMAHAVKLRYYEISNSHDIFGLEAQHDETLSWQRRTNERRSISVCRSNVCGGARAHARFTI